MFVILLALGVGILFFRTILARSIVRLVGLLGGSASKAVWIYSIITLPGILVHEIAHFLVAALLGLRTGSIELLPTLLADGGVELGSVQVEHKDPLRLALVGLAPLLFGIPLLLWIAAGIPPTDFSSPLSLLVQAQTWLVSPHVWLLYVLTTIVLHMFPSGRDMKSWPIAVFMIACFVWGLGMLGIRLPQTSLFFTRFQTVLVPLVSGFALALGAVVITVLVIRFAILFIKVRR